MYHPPRVLLATPAPGSQHQGPIAFSPKGHRVPTQGTLSGNKLKMTYMQQFRLISPENNDVQPVHAMKSQPPLLGPKVLASNQQAIERKQRQKELAVERRLLAAQVQQAQQEQQLTQQYHQMQNFHAHPSLSPRYTQSQQYSTSPFSTHASPSHPPMQPPAFYPPQHPSHTFDMSLHQAHAYSNTPAVPNVNPLPAHAERPYTSPAENLFATPKPPDHHSSIYDAKDANISQTSVKQHPDIDEDGLSLPPLNSRIPATAPSTSLHQLGDTTPRNHRGSRNFGGSNATQSTSAQTPNLSLNLNLEEKEETTMTIARPKSASGINNHRRGAEESPSNSNAGPGSSPTAAASPTSTSGPSSSTGPSSRLQPNPATEWIVHRGALLLTPRSSGFSSGLAPQLPPTVPRPPVASSSTTPSTGSMQLSKGGRAYALRRNPQANDNLSNFRFPTTKDELVEANKAAVKSNALPSSSRNSTTMQQLQQQQQQQQQQGLGDPSMQAQGDKPQQLSARAAYVINNLYSSTKAATSAAIAARERKKRNQTIFDYSSADNSEDDDDEGLGQHMGFHKSKDDVMDIYFFLTNPGCPIFKLTPQLLAASKAAKEQKAALEAEALLKSGGKTWSQIEAEEDRLELEKQFAKFVPSVTLSALAEYFQIDLPHLASLRDAAGGSVQGTLGYLSQICPMPSASSLGLPFDSFGSMDELIHTVKTMRERDVMAGLPPPLYNPKQNSSEIQREQQKQHMAAAMAALTSPTAAASLNPVDLHMSSATARAEPQQAHFEPRPDMWHSKKQTNNNYNSKSQETEEEEARRIAAELLGFTGAPASASQRSQQQQYQPQQHFSPQVSRRNIIHHQFEVGTSRTPLAASGPVSTPSSHSHTHAATTPSALNSHAATDPQLEILLNYLCSERGMALWIEPQRSPFVVPGVDAPPSHTSEVVKHHARLTRLIQVARNSLRGLIHTLETLRLVSVQVSSFQELVSLVDNSCAAVEAAQLDVLRYLNHPSTHLLLQLISEPNNTPVTMEDVQQLFIDGRCGFATMHVLQSLGHEKRLFSSVASLAVSLKKRGKEGRANVLELLAQPHCAHLLSPALLRSLQVYNKGVTIDSYLAAMSEARTEGERVAALADLVLNPPLDALTVLCQQAGPHTLLCLAELAGVDTLAQASFDGSAMANEPFDDLKSLLAAVQEAHQRLSSYEGALLEWLTQNRQRLFGKAAATAEAPSRKTAETQTEEFKSEPDTVHFTPFDASLIYSYAGTRALPMLSKLLAQNPSTTPMVSPTLEQSFVIPSPLAANRPSPLSDDTPSTDAPFRNVHDLTQWIHSEMADQIERERQEAHLADMYFNSFVPAHTSSRGQSANPHAKAAAANNLQLKPRNPFAFGSFTPKQISMLIRECGTALSSFRSSDALLLRMRQNKQSFATFQAFFDVLCVEHQSALDLQRKMLRFLRQESTTLCAHGPEDQPQPIEDADSLDQQPLLNAARLTLDDMQRLYEEGAGLSSLFMLRSMENLKRQHAAEVHEADGEWSWLHVSAIEGLIEGVQRLFAPEEERLAALEEQWRLESGMGKGDGASSRPFTPFGARPQSGLQGSTKARSSKQNRTMSAQSSNSQQQSPPSSSQVATPADPGASPVPVSSQADLEAELLASLEAQKAKQAEEEAAAIAAAAAAAAALAEKQRVDKVAAEEKAALLAAQNPTRPVSASHAAAPPLTTPLVDLSDEGDEDPQNDFPTFDLSQESQQQLVHYLQDHDTHLFDRAEQHQDAFRTPRGWATVGAVILNPRFLSNLVAAASPSRHSFEESMFFLRQLNEQNFNFRAGEDLIKSLEAERLIAKEKMEELYEYLSQPKQNLFQIDDPQDEDNILYLKLSREEVERLYVDSGAGLDIFEHLKVFSKIGIRFANLEEGIGGVKQRHEGLLKKRKTDKAILQQYLLNQHVLILLPPHLSATSPPPVILRSKLKLHRSDWNELFNICTSASMLLRHVEYMQWLGTRCESSKGFLQEVKRIHVSSFVLQQLILKFLQKKSTKLLRPSQGGNEDEQLTDDKGHSVSMREVDHLTLENILYMFEDGRAGHFTLDILVQLEKSGRQFDSFDDLVAHVKSIVRSDDFDPSMDTTSRMLEGEEESEDDEAAESTRAEITREAKQRIADYFHLPQVDLLKPVVSRIRPNSPPMSTINEDGDEMDENGQPATIAEEEEEEQLTIPLSSRFLSSVIEAASPEHHSVEETIFYLNQCNKNDFRFPDRRSLLLALRGERALAVKAQQTVIEWLASLKRKLFVVEQEDGKEVRVVLTNKDVDDLFWRTGAGHDLVDHLQLFHRMGMSFESKEEAMEACKKRVQKLEERDRVAQELLTSFFDDPNVLIIRDLTIPTAPHKFKLKKSEWTDLLKQGGDAFELARHLEFVHATIGNLDDAAALIQNVKQANVDAAVIKTHLLQFLRSPECQLLRGGASEEAIQETLDELTMDHMTRVFVDSNIGHWIMESVRELAEEVDENDNKIHRYANLEDLIGALQQLNFAPPILHKCSVISQEEYEAQKNDGTEGKKSKNFSINARDDLEQYLQSKACTLTHRADSADKKDEAEDDGEYSMDEVDEDGADNDGWAGKVRLSIQNLDRILQTASFPPRHDPSEALFYLRSLVASDAGKTYVRSTSHLCALAGAHRDSPEHVGNIQKLMEQINSSSKPWFVKEDENGQQERWLLNEVEVRRLYGESGAGLSVSTFLPTLCGDKKFVYPTGLSDATFAIAAAHEQQEARREKEIRELRLYLAQEEVSLLQPFTSGSNSSTPAVSGRVPYNREDILSLLACGSSGKEVLRHLEQLQLQQKQFQSIDALLASTQLMQLQWETVLRPELLAYLQAESTFVLRGDVSHFLADGTMHTAAVDKLTLADMSRIFTDSGAGHRALSILKQLNDEQHLTLRTLDELVKVLSRNTPALFQAPVPPSIREETEEEVTTGERRATFRPADMKQVNTALKDREQFGPLSPKGKDVNLDAAANTIDPSLDQISDTKMGHMDVVALSEYFMSDECQLISAPKSAPANSHLLELLLVSGGDIATCMEVLKTMNSHGVKAEGRELLAPFKAAQRSQLLEAVIASVDAEITPSTREAIETSYDFLSSDQCRLHPFSLIHVRLDREDRIDWEQINQQLAKSKQRLNFLSVPFFKHLIKFTNNPSSNNNNPSGGGAAAGMNLALIYLQHLAALELSFDVPSALLKTILTHHSLCDKAQRQLRTNLLLADMADTGVSSPHSNISLASSDSSSGIVRRGSSSATSRSQRVYTVQVPSQLTRSVDELRNSTKQVEAQCPKLQPVMDPLVPTLRDLTPTMTSLQRTLSEFLPQLQRSAAEAKENSVPPENDTATAAILQTHLGSFLRSLQPWIVQLRPYLASLTPFFTELQPFLSFTQAYFTLLHPFLNLVQPHVLRSEPFLLHMTDSLSTALGALLKIHPILRELDPFIHQLFKFILDLSAFLLQIQELLQVLNVYHNVPATNVDGDVIKNLASQSNFNAWLNDEKQKDAAGTGSVRAAAAATAVAPSSATGNTAPSPTNLVSKYERFLTHMNPYVTQLRPFNDEMKLFLEGFVPFVSQLTPFYRESLKPVLISVLPLLVPLQLPTSATLAKLHSTDGILNRMAGGDRRGSLSANGPGSRSDSQNSAAASLSETEDNSS